MQNFEYIKINVSGIQKKGGESRGGLKGYSPLDLDPLSLASYNFSCPNLTGNGKGLMRRKNILGFQSNTYMLEPL